MKILIICTGNTCRSPMAEGFLKSLEPDLEVHSAGMFPESEVNPLAVKVMKEIMVDISQHKPTGINDIQTKRFDLLITIGDQAKGCIGSNMERAENYLHLDIPDPANTVGSETTKLNIYRQTRDEIKNEFFKIFINHIKNQIK